MIPQKLKIEIPYDPAVPLLSMYVKKTKTLIQKGPFTLMLIALLFIIAKTWKLPKCLSMDEWIKKTCTHTHTHTYTYTQKGIHSAVRKKRHTFSC